MTPVVQSLDAWSRSSIEPRLLLMHQVMLADRVRLDAYRRALAMTIAPGDVVADVGAGVLVLSFLAIEAGARHVYAIEGDLNTFALARRIVEHNRLESRITLVHGDARYVSLPEKVDVLVSEMMGNLGPEEEMAEVLIGAAARNLRPGGRIVPARLATSVRAIAFDGEGWGIWSSDVAGYSLRAIQDCAASEAQVHFFARDPALLSAPINVADQELGAGAGFDGGPHHLTITAPGTLHAIMGYFTATLAHGLTLSNFPSYPGCNWGVWIWPVRHTVVVPGDVVRLHVERSALVRDVSQWRVECSVARTGSRT